MKKVVMLIVSLMVLMSCSDESITGPTNNAPVIISLTANPMFVQQNDSSVITCFASDADEDSLTYSWDKTGGTIDGSGSSITWLAPNTIEAHTITCTVSDGEATDTRSININSTNNGSIFLFNGLGDVGTLSIIDNDGQIANDVMNVGKWPNHISEDGGTLYVVNSGNNNIQMINASNNDNMGSIELTAYSNPMKSVVCNGKVYATNMFGSGIDVYSFGKDSLKTIPITDVPDSCINGGTDAIITYGDKVFVGIKNITYDQDWNAIYGLEYVIVINSLTDEIEVAAEVGYNISDMLIDSEGELNVLCSGNRDDINGLVKVYNATDITQPILEQIYFGSQPSSLIMNSIGMVYVGIAGLNPDWTGFGGIMKYNSVTNEVINNSENLLYTSTTSGIMDIAIDGYDNLYVPIFDNNELIVFENDVVDTILTTGNGPQGLVFVKK